MPTSVKSREKSTYYNSYSTYNSRAYSGRQIYGNTSSAYDIPPVHTDRAIKSTPTKKKPQSITQLRISRKRVTQIIIAVAAVFVLCCTVIYRYAAILESNQQISALEKQYTDMIAANQALQTRIDRGLEMGEIEKYAREELGMMKPESYQMFYVDMKLADDGVSTQVTDGKNMITGTPGALVNAFRVLK